MTVSFSAVKCCRFLPSTICRWYHPSSSLYKWPLALKGDTKTVSSAKKVKIWEGMTVWDLARSLKKDLGYVNEILKPSFSNKMDSLSGEIKDFHSIKDFLNKENLEYNVVKMKAKSLNVGEKQEKKIVKPITPSKNEVKRPPVVTIMGHVDHGKTTLLDALRNSNIVEKEFGGITQHIGAFSVTLTPGKTVTFIDTPGHAAFSAMRNRGAEVTDIVVLIVAADDGVMEQTIESINMAKNAGVKVIVAVNKIDKGEHNLAVIKQQLLKEGIQAEDLGGDVQFVPVSALKRINLDLLIETILLESEMMALTGDPKAPVEGVIIESSVGKKGKLATIIVKRGTLRKRVILVAGSTIARVRGMFDEDGRELSQVTLSQPAQIIGWQDLPNAGEQVFEVSSQKEANTFLREQKRELQRQKVLKDYVPIQEKAVQEKADFTEKKKEITQLRVEKNIEGLKKFYAKKPTEKQEEGPRLNIIVKGDVDGSVDAILDVLETYNHDEECKLSLIHYGVGEVTESDLVLAKTFDAIIYCFNLNFPQSLKAQITAQGISIKFHNIIYKFIDDLKGELTQRIPEVEEDAIIGTGEVLQHFVISEGKKPVPVAGAVCTMGEFKRKTIYRVIRDEKVIYEGEIRSLKHFKNEVNTVKKNTQCGIMFQDFQGEFKRGDKIVCLEKKLVRYATSWDPGF